MTSEDIKHQLIIIIKSPSKTRKGFTRDDFDILATYSGLLHDFTDTDIRHKMAVLAVVFSLLLNVDFEQTGLEIE